MLQRSRVIATLGITALLLLLPASAVANVGGAAPRLQTIDDEAHPRVKNVGGAGPGSVVEGSTLAFANVGGAGPTTNVGGQERPSLGLQTTESIRNVGGAGPWSLTQWMLDLFLID